MRGHLVKRYKGSWSIVLDLGRQRDPKTGLLKRVQKWFSCTGTKKEAEEHLNDLLHRYHRSEVLEPSKILLGDWLDRWLDTAVKPGKALRTYETYRSIIDKHLKPSLGIMRSVRCNLISLRPTTTRALLIPRLLKIIITCSPEPWASPCAIS